METIEETPLILCNCKRRSKERNARIHCLYCYNPRDDYAKGKRVELLFSHLVFSDLKFSTSSLGNYRRLIYTNSKGISRPIKSMEENELLTALDAINFGLIRETQEYSLPFLTFCIHQEIVHKREEREEVANRILLSFNNSKIKYLINQDIMIKTQIR